jgi:hypothetical protein
MLIEVGSHSTSEADKKLSFCESVLRECIYNCIKNPIFAIKVFVLSVAIKLRMLTVPRIVREFYGKGIVTVFGSGNGVVTLKLTFERNKVIIKEKRGLGSEEGSGKVFRLRNSCARASRHPFYSLAQ